MTIQGNRSSVGIPPNLIIVGITLLFLIAVAGWYVYQRNTAVHTVPVAVVKQRSDLFLQMTQKCHGNFALLSPEDQATVQKASNGNGPSVIQGTALHYGIR